MPSGITAFHEGWKTRKTLIARVANSCESSWREFYLIYKGFVASVAMRRGVLPDDVDDLIQTIFMEVHRDLCKPQPPDFGDRSFGAWLGQKVKWRVGEYHRHRHRKEHATPPRDLDTALPDCPFENLWEHEWERKVLEVAMARVVDKPRNLLVFQALAIQNMPMEEVCGMFGISRTNADTIKKRVKDKLEPIVREIETGVI